MTGNKTRVLEDKKIDVKLKLAGLWTTVMLIYVYVDIIGFYELGLLKRY